MTNFTNEYPLFISNIGWECILIFIFGLSYLTSTYVTLGLSFATVKTFCSFRISGDDKE